MPDTNTSIYRQTVTIPFLTRMHPFNNHFLEHKCYTQMRLFNTSPFTAIASWKIFLLKRSSLLGKLLNDIGNGLKNENLYCKDLQQLGICVWQGGLTADANVVPRMVDQPPCMARSVCAVMNCRLTGVMSLQVTTTNGNISDVKMNLEHLEGLCYPLLFPHGEPGFTNEMKDRISPADYVMVRMLMPEKIWRKYMTAHTRYYSET